MDTRLLLFVGVITGLVAIGLTRMFFSQRDRGLSASQWLLAVMIWGLMMLAYYTYQRIF